MPARIGFRMWSKPRVLSGIELLVDRALGARASLLNDPGVEAFRVFNGRCDGLEGLVIEKFGPVCIAQLHEEKLSRPEAEVRAIVEAFHERLGATATYRKMFVRDRARVGPDVTGLHSDARPWIGEPVPEELIIQENGIRLVVRPYDGFSVGLFLEHRDNRNRIRALAAGRRVLNAFSYTGGFSVAAAIGGAASVASVDVSKRYLEWSKRSFSANGIDAAPHRFYCSDVFEFYVRAKRQKLRYDLIVLDPPTFSRVPRSRRVFEIERQLDELVSKAVELLEPDGIVLLATNCRGLSRQQLEQALVLAGGARRCAVIERPALPVDFAGDPEYSKTVIGRLGGPA